MSKASRERERERARPSKRSEKWREAYAGVDTQALADMVGQMVEELSLRDGGGLTTAVVELNREGGEHKMVLLKGVMILPRGGERVGGEPKKPDSPEALKAERDAMMKAIGEHVAEREGLSGEELAHFQRLWAEWQALPDDARLTTDDMLDMHFSTMTPEQLRESAEEDVLALAEGATGPEKAFWRAYDSARERALGAAIERLGGPVGKAEAGARP